MATMKTPFLPLYSVATTFACALITASTFAQAPAPAPAPAAPAVPAVPAAPAPPAAPAGAPAATPAPAPLGSPEKIFIKNAAKSVFFQLELTKAANVGTTDPNLVRFHDGTIRDLTKVKDAISKLATARGEKITDQLEGTDKADVERVGKQKEDKVAKLWLETLAKESKKLDRDFESASKGLHDQDVKMLTVNYGPLVRGVFSDSESALKIPPKKK